jgi:hypothetical protein
VNWTAVEIMASSTPTNKHHPCGNSIAFLTNGIGFNRSGIQPLRATLAPLRNTSTDEVRDKAEFRCGSIHQGGSPQRQIL